MINRSICRIALCCMILVTSLQANAQLAVKRTVNPSRFALGIGGLSLSSTSANAQLFSIIASYRHRVVGTSFSVIAQVNPLFQTSSVFGVQLAGGAAYRLVGKDAQRVEYTVDQQPIFRASQAETPFTLDFDASFSLLPIFGSTSTVTYSGFMFGPTAHFRKWSSSIGLQYSALSLGTKRVSMVGLYIMYVW